MPGILSGYCQLIDRNSEEATYKWGAMMLLFLFLLLACMPGLTALCVSWWGVAAVRRLSPNGNAVCYFVLFNHICMSLSHGHGNLKICSAIFARAAEHRGGGKGPLWSKSNIWWVPHARIRCRRGQITAFLWCHKNWFGFLNCKCRSFSSRIMLILQC